MTYEAVKANIDSIRKCATPERHATYQPEAYSGRLFVAESLDPDDVLYFVQCGLCAGFIRYITRAEWEARPRQ